MSIAIVDYGMVKRRSVQKAFEQVGFHGDIISQPEEVAKADKIVLPGVGAFQDAVATLRDKGLDDPILAHIKKGKLFLGICLGFQMLFDVGYEDGVHKGLGLFPGKCIRFDVDEEQGLKVPHMRWNQLDFRVQSPLTRDLKPQSCVYFVHGYHVVTDDKSLIATTTDYGGLFVSIIWRDNVMSTQFHPEKSQKAGLQMLANFGGL